MCRKFARGLLIYFPPLNSRDTKICFFKTLSYSVKFLLSDTCISPSRIQNFQNLFYKNLFKIFSSLTKGKDLSIRLSANSHYMKRDLKRIECIVLANGYLGERKTILWKRKKKNWRSLKSWFFPKRQMIYRYSSGHIRIKLLPELYGNGLKVARIFILLENAFEGGRSTNGDFSSLPLAAFFFSFSIAKVFTRVFEEVKFNHDESLFKCRE